MAGHRMLFCSKISGIGKIICVVKMLPMAIMALMLFSSACLDLSHLQIAMAHTNNGVLYKPVELDALDGNAPPGTHPVHFSEYKLRSIIESANDELRQLKRDFLKEIVDNYYRLKSDRLIGFKAAQMEASPVSLASALMANDLGDMIVKRHIIQRRVVAGLKAAFVKFLPLRTLRRLVEKFPSYAWLKHQNQVDLRPKFPSANEHQFVKLYSLLELRARIRAADDVVTLTANNMKRILMLIHWILIERHEEEANAEQLKALAGHASRVINFYLDEVVNGQSRLQDTFNSLAATSSRIISQAGGEAKFLSFLDEIIDSEALDIELNVEANGLDMPPTINEEMINNVERRWVPWKVLDSLDDDRSLLLDHKADIRHLLMLQPEDEDADLAQLASQMLRFLCSQNYSFE